MKDLQKYFTLRKELFWSMSVLVIILIMVIGYKLLKQGV